MKRGLLVFLAMCALAIAMVPRDRRAINPEEQSEQTTVKANINVTVCAETTPCAWSVYKPITKLIDVNITNTYCICSADTVCAMDEDDDRMSAYVFRCRKPGHVMEDS